jgi:hypothetical protein
LIWHLDGVGTVLPFRVGTAPQALLRVLEEFDRSKFISEIDNFAKHDL